MFLTLSLDPASYGRWFFHGLRFNYITFAEARQHALGVGFGLRMAWCRPVDVHRVAARPVAFPDV